MPTLQRYLPVSNENEIHLPQTEFWGSEVEQQQQSDPDTENWGVVRGDDPAEPDARRTKPDASRAEPDVRRTESGARGAEPEQHQAGGQQLSPWCHGVPGVQLQPLSRSSSF